MSPIRCDRPAAYDERQGNACVFLFKMTSLWRLLALGGVLVLLVQGVSHAQGGGPPPAKVTVEESIPGRLAPTAPFKGTVQFKESSELASEVAGKALEVLFEEGYHLDAGEPMVRLDSELLQAQLDAARALRKQRQAELDLEETRLTRAKILLDDEVTTEQEYDDIRFTVDALRHQVESAGAQVRRMEEMLERKTIRAPYSGVVLRRLIERGEWLEEGETFANYASDALHDVIVFLPEKHLPFVERGANVEMTIMDQRIEGTITEGSPVGDPATRTFPIKIRLVDRPWLLEGMSAEVQMPIGDVTECTLVPRDAVLVGTRGDTSVVLAQDGQGIDTPVDVLGYQDRYAGVPSDVVPPGLQVIVKGHERLRPGQPIQIMNK